jgi:cyclopropane-fatty-acyl-phospholipid synthase
LGSSKGLTHSSNENGSSFLPRLTWFAERGWLPDFVVRYGVRQLLGQRIRDNVLQRKDTSIDDFINATKVQPIALATDKANEQHYEVPTAFFEQVLGTRLKYSCCFWEPTTTSLNDAEIAALKLTCEHAELADGMSILELGCGWGSLSLWMAEQYPASTITAVSNSRTQREYIESQGRERGLSNLRVVTCDVNQFDPHTTFDRVVSVEMFEHVRNHSCLLERIDRWLRVDGKLFVHVFCHFDIPYLFHSFGAKDWMGRHFFSGGMMPSFDLLPSVPSPLALQQSWKWNGEHYAKTCRAWLENQDAAASEILSILESTYGRELAVVWHNRWRMFFIACEELFAFNSGQEWFVAHYLFAKSSGG